MSNQTTSHKVGTKEIYVKMLVIEVHEVWLSKNKTRQLTSILKQRKYCNTTDPLMHVVIITQTCMACYR